MNLPRRTEEMPLSNCRFQSAGWQVSSVWSGFLIHNLSLKGLFYSFWFASFIRVLFITTVSTSWMCTISGTAKSVAWTDTCSLLKKAALIKYYHLICIAGPDNYTHTFHLASFLLLHSWWRRYGSPDCTGDTTETLRDSVRCLRS